MRDKKNRRDSLRRLHAVRVFADYCMHIRHMLDIGIIMPDSPLATKAVAGC